MTANRFQACWILCVLATAGAAQTSYTVHLPDAAPNVGVIGNVIPFSSSFGTTPGSMTHLEVIPAASLLAAGIPAGSQVTDIQFAPTGSGVLTIPTFRVKLGHLGTSLPAGAFTAEFGDSVTVFDSSVSGPFVWAVTGNQWNSLGVGGGGFTWDGIHDVGVYSTHVGLTVQATAGWPASFWRSGTIWRQWASGYQTSTATGVAQTGLKIGLSFLINSNTPAVATTFGQGTAGNLGVPVMLANGVPGFGNEAFGIAVAAAFPNTTAVLVCSHHVANLSVGTSGAEVRLLVDLAPSQFLGLFSMPVDVGGSAWMPLPIGPFDPSLLGYHAVCQWFILGDISGQPTTFGVNVAASQGLDLTVGF